VASVLLHALTALLSRRWMRPSLRLLTLRVLRVQLLTLASGVLLQPQATQEIALTSPLLLSTRVTSRW
jgi:hypothetical protein